MLHSVERGHLPPLFVSSFLGSVREVLPWPEIPSLILLYAYARWMVSSEGQEDTESRSIGQADFAQKKAADFLKVC